MAGGYDSMDWFKDRIVRPKAVIDLTGIAEMKGIKETADGVEIGALTTLTEIENNPIIKSKYRLLANAVCHVASPQIRNNGTMGGNVSQNARCLYFRYGLPCYRAGGTTCFADTPEGINREHALFGADRCVAVSSSDGAPALTALDAQFVIQSSGGQRVVGAEDFFVGPRCRHHAFDLDQARRNTHRDPPAQDTGPARISISRRSPTGTPGISRWSMSRPRSRCRTAPSQDSRIVVGGVSAVPHRLTQVEGIIQGKTLDESVATLAGQSSTRDARPLNYNGFKIPLMANLVTRAVRNATA